MTVTPLSVRLEALRSLAETAPSALPLGMNAVSISPEGVLTIAQPPQPSKLRFTADGLPFQASVTPNGEEAVCQVWAEVGHIPYTAQSPERRRRMLAVVKGAEKLPTARFIIQGSHMILLFSERRLPGRVMPEDLIWQTVQLIQEARPFLRMIGEYL
jgi:hypothetical protein